MTHADIPGDVRIGGGPTTEELAANAGGTDPMNPPPGKGKIEMHEDALIPPSQRGGGHTKVDPENEERVRDQMKDVPAIDEENQEGAQEKRLVDEAYEDAAKPDNSAHNSSPDANPGAD